MNCSKWKNDIMSANLKPIYIFENNDKSLSKFFLERFCSLYSGKLIKLQSIDKANKMSLFFEESLEKTIYWYDCQDESDICIDDLLAFTKDSGYNHMVIMIKSIDKRKSLYKKFKDCIVTFEDVCLHDFVAHFEDIYPELFEHHIVWLVQNCNFSFEFLNNCFKMVDSYSKGAYIPQNTAFMQLKEADMFLQKETTSLDEMCLYALIGDNKSAIQIYRNKVKKEEQPIKCLTQLFYAFRNTNLYLSYKGNKDPLSVCGLTEYEIKKWKPAFQYINDERINKIGKQLEIMIKLINEVKDGKIDAGLAVKYFLIQC